MQQRGFTILELLIAIAIIGLLTAFAMAGFSRAKLKAQDTRRIEDVKEIQKALALYAAGNQTYPIAAARTNLTGSDSVSTALITFGTMPSMPRDPAPGRAYTYQSNAAGTTYTITFCLDTNTIPSYTQGCSNTITP